MGVKTEGGVTLKSGKKGYKGFRWRGNLDFQSYDVNLTIKKCNQAV